MDGDTNREQMGRETTTLARASTPLPSAPHPAVHTARGQLILSGNGHPFEDRMGCGNGASPSKGSDAALCHAKGRMGRDVGLTVRTLLDLAVT